MTQTPDALFARAIGLLTGEAGRRDVPAARQLLRAAAERGHHDADLYEIALAANGSGGPRDWPAAFDRLRRAARRDPALAGRQLEMIEAMALDEAGFPLSLSDPERLSDAPAVVRYPALLTAPECQAVAAAVADIMEPAAVVDPSTGRQVRHPIRTSDGAVVGPTRESLPVAAINRRLAAASGTAVEQGESLAVLRYRSGDQYRLHHDAIDGARNQRIKTALVYLNDGYGGGETEFPELGLRIAGRAGDVVVFDNLDGAGRADARARHAGRPVTRGVKWLATRWIRRKAVDPWDPTTQR